MLTDVEAVGRVVREARTIAVLGAHTDEYRPAHYVPAALFAAGFTIVPVNAKLAGQSLFSRPVLASLADVDEPVDILDVFRRSVDLPAHLAEILAMKHLPKVVWFQSGIRNDAVAQALADAGIDVVQDRCLMVDQRRFGGPRP